MAMIQVQFEEFHSNIRLSEDDEHANLREKRDTLLKHLRERLDEGVPSYEDFHQGSYSMNTGTKPLDGNYDIDIGLIFDCTKQAYPDPVELKTKVKDALTHGNRSVQVRRPCVTVTYIKDGKPEYHVDLAVYVKRGDNLLDIAMGKENSEQSRRIWEVSNPKALTDTIKNRFKDEDAAQYRRCIRYLKRWRDLRFSNGNPISIALTVAAYKWFQPEKDFFSSKYIDLAAMEKWTGTILGQFQSVWHDEELAERLAIELPVSPFNDLMSKMTNNQMKDFQEKLKKLNEELKAARTEELPEVACKKMRGQFGDEFPIPDKEDTARKTNKAPYVSTGSSA